jgi:hypothetical protein
VTKKEASFRHRQEVIPTLAGTKINCGGTQKNGHASAGRHPDCLKRNVMPAQAGIQTSLQA